MVRLHGNLIEVMVLNQGERSARDKTNLEIFRLKDESLENTENLPEPSVIAADIVE